MLSRGPTHLMQPSQTLLRNLCEKYLSNRGFRLRLSNLKATWRPWRWWLSWLCFHCQRSEVQIQSRGKKLLWTYLLLTVEKTKIKKLDGPAKKDSNNPHPNCPPPSFMPPFAWVHSCLTFSLLRTAKTAATSVTRWLDYLFNIWALTTMLICP